MISHRINTNREEQKPLLEKKRYTAEVVVFLVSGVRYEIPLSQIKTFPLQTALVNVLVSKLETESFGVKLSADGEIVIELPKSNDELELLEKFNNPSKVSCTKLNFAKLVKIYANPKITLFELLDIQTFLGSADVAYAKKFLVGTDALEENPQYNFIRQSNYQNFLEELDYYGVLSLFQSELVRNGIDTEHIVKTFKDNLKELFPTTNGFLRRDSMANEFFYQILSMGGIFSGSFLLRAILDEDWNSHNPGDVDVYVNIYMLEGMLGFNNLESRYQEFQESADSLEADMRKTFGKDISSEEVNKRVSLPLSQLMGALGRFENREDQEEQFRARVAASVKKRLGAREATIAKSNLAHTYAFTDRIEYVIKIKMDNFDLDMVVIESTVPYMIGTNFDFNFCQVYYDGYAVHALNWEAVANKCSLELSHQHRSGHYSDNLGRISKYMRRGFVVMTDDTNEYVKEKQAAALKKVSSIPYVKFSDMVDAFQAKEVKLRIV